MRNTLLLFIAFILFGCGDGCPDEYKLSLDRRLEKLINEIGLYSEAELEWEKTAAGYHKYDWKGDSEFPNHGCYLITINKGLISKYEPKPFINPMTGLALSSPKGLNKKLIDSVLLNAKDFCYSDANGDYEVQITLSNPPSVKIFNEVTKAYE